ncbi:MAG TPA: RNA 2',3'-cyclic phosphodiesterase [archaeon]|nr:RNA 2',3'-cyclic phosphodiesterase [archaeon]
MRTFIAVEPPDSVRDEIGRLTGRLKDHLPGLRWSKPKNIHLTLRFLGEIDPALLETLKKGVEGAVSPLAPFSLTVEDIGFFGSRIWPRIVWLGLEGSDELAALAKAVENAAVETGFGKADKPFKAHLTLARIKDKLAHPPDWERTRGTLPENWPAWPVDEVQIIKSTLTPSGPIYETLAHCALKG